MLVLTAAVLFSKYVCGPAGNTAVLQTQDICNCLKGPIAAVRKLGWSISKHFNGTCDQKQKCRTGDLVLSQEVDSVQR